MLTCRETGRSLEEQLWLGGAGREAQRLAENAAVHDIGLVGGVTAWTWTSLTAAAAAHTSHAPASEGETG